MHTLMEEDSEAHHYASDSVKQANGVRYRPSFLMNFLNTNFRQSGRKRSVQKTESFREAQAHSNPSFTINMEKTAGMQSSPPANSRKSSIAKRSSPAHSRTSSISFRPSSISKHRRKSYDVQHIENTLANISMPEYEGEGATTTTVPPVPAIGNSDDGTANTCSAMESDAGHQRMDSYMPSIPEEPSRVTSMINLDSNAIESNSCPPKQRDDVQALVAEASKVLEELNKAVKTGRHRKECESKGYESCCSLSSDDSSDNDDNESDSAADEKSKSNSESVLVDDSTKSSNSRGNPQSVEL